VKGRFAAIVFCWVIFIQPVMAKAAADPLPSWNGGPTRQRILDFVRAITDKSSKDFVAPESRIAVFDNDGTLWCEKPVYTQFVFAVERAQEVIEQHPELAEETVFKAARERDFEALANAGEKGLLRLVTATHSGMTSEQFKKIVKDWIAEAKHPRFKRLYTECVYQPMLELLGFLRKNEFRTFIISGGGRDFMRPWTGSVYGVEDSQVVGSSCKLEYRDGDVYRTPEVEFIDDGKFKPVGIEKCIGLRPIAAFGNSDGDLEMLQWTSGNKGKTLCAIVHHTDAGREYAYDKDSSVGHLEKALQEARRKDWLVVDMKNDWSKVFPR